MEHRIFKIGSAPVEERLHAAQSEVRVGGKVVAPPVPIGSRAPSDDSPILGIPSEQVQLDTKSRLFFHTDPHSSASDRYRLLRLRLSEFKAGLKLKTILVTSPNPGEGKSTTVINLATALVGQGQSRVLVVEADLYHSCLTELVGIKTIEGLGECLERSLNPFAALRRLDPLGWYLLPAGKVSMSPTELLSRDAFAQMMQKLAPHFDWVLIDSPPVMPLADSLLLKSSADATLLIARAGHTPKKDIERCLSQIGREHVLGVVLNATEHVNHLYSKYSKYYGYYYRQTGKGSK